MRWPSLIQFALVFIILTVSYTKADIPDEQYWGHKGTYLIFGKPDTKFQASFKYLFIKKHLAYFGYTQLTFWDIFLQSFPLKDINLSPEIFKRINIDRPYINKLDIGLYEHLSNGKDGLESKAWDRFYIKGYGEKKFKYFELGWDYKAYYFYSVARQTTGIRKHIGHLETTFYISNLFNNFIVDDKFSARIIWGGLYSHRPNLGAQELNYIFSIRPLRHHVKFRIQYYHGYMESLLYYDRHVSALRIGFGLD